jgi:hypothetical protein
MVMPAATTTAPSPDLKAAIMRILPKTSHNIGTGVAATSASLAACTMLASLLLHAVPSPPSTVGATSTPMGVERSWRSRSNDLFPSAALRDRPSSVVTILAPVGDGWS